MTARKNLSVVVGFAMLCSMLVLMGHIVPPAASWGSLLAVWNDVMRDVDDFGLQLTTVPDRDEVAFGKELALNFDRMLGNDPDASRYVSEVAAALIPYTQRNGLPWRFRVVGGMLPNAFALPGGQIYVTEGMLRFAESEAELAYVVGHEMAHVDLRHCVRRYQYQLKLKKVGAGEVGEIADVARLPIEIGYTKYQEMEADAEAARIASDAGYDPHAGVSLMFRFAAHEGSMTSAARTPGSEVAGASLEVLGDYLRSHPASAERAAAIRDLLAAQHSRLAGHKYALGEENLRRRISISRQQFPK